MRPNLSWALAGSPSRLPRATGDAFVRGPASAEGPGGGGARWHQVTEPGVTFLSRSVHKRQVRDARYHDNSTVIIVHIAHMTLHHRRLQTSVCPYVPSAFDQGNNYNSGKGNIKSSWAVPRSMKCSFNRNMMEVMKEELD